MAGLARPSLSTGSLAPSIVIRHDAPTLWYDLSNG